jgi:murein L,D-transpeptidase YcbB/YkuD
MHLRLPIFFALFGLGAMFAVAPARSAQSTLAPEIRTLVAGGAGDSGAPSALARFYALRDYEPAWVDAPAHVSALLTALAEASQQGLVFPVAKSLLAGGSGGAARDVALTKLALDYATALASGSVRPDTFETDWAIPAPSFDAAAGLAGALDRDLAAWYAGLAPHHPAYQRLEAALASYRALAVGGGWSTVPRGDPLKLGMVDPRVLALRHRLAAEGDLAQAPLAPAPAAPPAPMASNGTGAAPVVEVAVVGQADAASLAAADPGTIYDGIVEEAVKHFQSRNGIAVDGTVGPRTLAALNVPVRARIRQIELNLERWRSLPHDFGPSYIMVNVPAERLDIVDRDVLVITMKVVVGDVGHPTPVLRATMSAVTLDPTWTIPASIVTNELMPKSKRDPGYLRKNDIVFTPGRGWQQLPGPKNPLGRIKFESPNRFDVYLHDTPSRFAFDRYFRAQSHGCVRLERAAEVAGYVLQGTAWNEPTLADAVTAGATRRIDLKRRWRIYILYATSFVDDDGTVEFRDDLYGRDERLAKSLAATRPHLEPQRQATLGRL